MFSVAFPPFKMDFVIVFHFCIQSSLFWLINVYKKYNLSWCFSFLFPSKKELCMGSRALLITLEINLKAFPCQRPRPYHSPFKPSGNCLSVHPGIFVWFWWHQGLHLQEDSRKCSSLNPFLIALIETGQRGNSGPIDYLKTKRPTLQYGCFFTKLFPSALTGCPGEVRICKIHFCQSYNQNKRFFIKNQSRLATMLFIPAAGRNLRQKSPKHTCTQNTWAYSPAAHLGAATIFEYNFGERKIEHSTYKEHGFGRY